MTSDRKILLENSIAIILTQVVSYVAPFVALPYLSRVLGVEKFGLVFWAQAAMNYFIIITNFGFNMSSVREIAIAKGDNDKISKIFNCVLIAKFVLLLISLGILTAFIFAIPKFRAEMLLFYLTFGMVAGNALYPNWFFQGIEHMKYITFLNIVTKLLFLVLIFIFVRSPENYILVAILNALGFIISGIIGIYLAVKRFNVKLYIPKIKDIVDEMKSSFDFFIGRFSESIFQTTGPVCLGLLTNPVTIGYYVAAEKLYNGLGYLQAPLTTAIYPYMSKTRDVNFYKKLFLYIIAGLFIIASIVFVLAPYIIKMFYGPDMLPAYHTLRIFSITFFFAFLCGITRYPFVGALGHVKVVNYSATFAAFVQIILLTVLYYTKSLNINSIAYMTILPEVIMICFTIYTVKKYKLL